MDIVYLYPKAGQRTPLRSDTLWGLLCWGIRLVWGEKELLNILAGYLREEPPFLVSSAFPFTEKNGQPLLFFPKPVFKPFQLTETEMTPQTMQNYKHYKKMIYVPLETFVPLVSGDLDEKVFFLNHAGDWKNAEPLPGEQELVMHNNIDRLKGSTMKEDGLFQAEEQFYASTEGLFFLLDIRQSELSDKFAALWQFFEHAGLGGDMSTGKGHFVIRQEPFTAFDNLPNSKRFVSLSLYYPTNDEREFYSHNLDQTWYRLEQRKGKVGGKFFVTPHFIKQSMTVFSEGSSFPTMDKLYYGNNPIVKNLKEHKVYQYGYAFAIPRKQ